MSVRATIRSPWNYFFLSIIFSILCFFVVTLPPVHASSLTGDILKFKIKSKLQDISIKLEKSGVLDTMSAARLVEALIHEYGKLVFHTIYGLTGDWEESQDLSQDTFHQALRGIEAARAASGDQFRPKAWLLRIALNTVRMQRRRRAILRFIPFSHLQERPESDRREVERDIVNEQAAPVQPAGFGAVEADDPEELIAEQDAVRRTMAKLPEPLRVCLLLSVLGGLSSAEIATMLDLKEAAVRQRLSRARKQFQQLYAYESGETLFDGTATDPTHPMNEDRVEQQTLHDKPRRLSFSTRSSTTRRSYA